MTTLMDTIIRNLPHNSRAVLNCLDSKSFISVSRMNNTFQFICHAIPSDTRQDSNASHTGCIQLHESVTTILLLSISKLRKQSRKQSNGPDYTFAVAPLCGIGAKAFDQSKLNVHRIFAQSAMELTYPVLELVLYDIQNSYTAPPHDWVIRRVDDKSESL